LLLPGKNRGSMWKIESMFRSVRCSEEGKNEEFFFRSVRLREGSGMSI